MSSTTENENVIDDTTTATEPVKTPSEVLAEIDSSNNPVAPVIAAKMLADCDNLTSLAALVGSTTETDPNAPKKPNIGVVGKTASESTDETVKEQFAKWKAQQAVAKVEYKALFALLFPEWVSEDDTEEIDDSERKQYIEEAKSYWTSIKAGVNYLKDMDGVPDTFEAEFLASVPKVEGARMITSAPGTTKRPTFKSIAITLGDNEPWTVTTFTEAATLLKQNGSNKSVTAGDLSTVFYENGGTEAETDTVVEFVFGDFKFSCVKK